MGNGLLKKANKTASHLLKDYLQLDHYDSILRQKSFMVIFILLLYQINIYLIYM